MQPFGYNPYGWNNTWGMGYNPYGYNAYGYGYNPYGNRWNAWNGVTNFGNTTSSPSNDPIKTGVNYGGRRPNKYRRSGGQGSTSGRIANYSSDWRSEVVTEGDFRTSIEDFQRVGRTACRICSKITSSAFDNAPNWQQQALECGSTHSIHAQ